MANIELLRKNLESLEYETSFFATEEECIEYLHREIDGKTIGFGGSQTVSDMGLLKKLSSHNTCIKHWDKEKEIVNEKAASADVYICSVNGVAETGEMVNIDGGGNRLSATLYGHQKIYFIIGTNKIVPNLEQAIWRARNIAAPKNAQRLGLETPCAVKADRCYNCKAPNRICAAMTIYWKKPHLVPRIEVVIIDKNMGF